MSRAKKAKRAAGKRVTLTGGSVTRQSQPPLTADRALRQCIAAIGLLQVTVNSLESQGIQPEQSALQCASRAMWDAHDFLAGLQDPDSGDDEPPEHEGRS